MGYNITLTDKSKALPKEVDADIISGLLPRNNLFSIKKALCSIDKGSFFYIYIYQIGANYDIFRRKYDTNKHTQRQKVRYILTFY